MGLRFELPNGTTIDVPPEIQAEGDAAVDAFYHAALAALTPTAAPRAEEEE